MVKTKKEKKEAFIKTVEKKVVILSSYIGLKNITQDIFFYNFQKLRLKQNRNDLVKQSWFYNQYIELFTPSVLTNFSKNFIGQKYYFDKTLTKQEIIKKTIDSFYGSIRKIYQFGKLSSNYDVNDFTIYLEKAYTNTFGGTIDRKTFHKYLLALRIPLNKPYSIKISEIYRYIYDDTLKCLIIDDIDKITKKCKDKRKKMLFILGMLGINNIKDLIKKLRHDVLIFLSRIPFQNFTSFSMSFKIRYDVFNIKNNYYDVQEFITLTRMNNNRKRLISSVRKSFRAIIKSFEAISTSIVYHIFLSDIRINLYK